MDRKEKLSSGIGKLMKLKGSCYFSVIDDLDISELSLRQLDYLKKFNCSEGMTTTHLAEVLDISKPTATEMVKRFVKMDLVYKQSCPADGRVYYVKLTERGQTIVNLEKTTWTYMAKKLSSQLNEEDLDTLIKILEKIE
ncbi:MarR family winged helix-turn-helix transcriptional regulator [Fusibacter sp. JL216-2]|uniref:MarR family winged helix-turn-helix transcriptional regulator n=1 Tax=Fusibacter sp. JL216-2 TaxID=3071453 RepID=UPI003D334B92